MKKTLNQKELYVAPKHSIVHITHKRSVMTGSNYTDEPKAEGNGFYGEIEG